MGWAFDENGDDVGADFADIDAWREMQIEILEIKDDRKRRIRDLAGKYIVITVGKSSGKTVFYQDRKVSSKGYWTQYLSNALGFIELSEAKLHAKGFKYGNPKVAIVNANGNYQFV